MRKPLVLCILDGCGIRKEKDGNAFLNANTPNLDMLKKEYPSSILYASGKAVGLPQGQMGTSEVGHMNIGAGRIFLQPIEKINRAIEDKSFFNNKEILDVFNHVKENNSNLHIMGLLSDGGVHSHINHLFSLLDMCRENNIEKVYIHPVLDGRDTYEKSAIKYLDMLNDKLNELSLGKIGVVSGRYYAMDRDNNFDRVKLFYDALVYNDAPVYDSYKKQIEESYKKGIYDEFLIPGIINKCTLNDNDAIVTFNFRKDRLREIFTVFSNPDCYEKLALDKNMNIKHFSNLKTLTMYPVTNTVISKHAFNDLDLKNILVDFLHNNNLSQLRLAETEKFAHVTFFFDGGREVEYNDMKKIIIPSPKVKTYDLKPEMSAYKVTNTFIKEALNYDVTIMNLANGDMVGHTGNYDAAKLAVEHMDKCIGMIYEKVKEIKGTLIITADHGNCDIMWDSNNNPVTSHTLNPVPFIVTKKDISLNDGRLCDIAPTIIELLDLEKPKEMTGISLIKH